MLKVEEKMSEKMDPNLKHRPEGTPPPDDTDQLRVKQGKLTDITLAELLYFGARTGMDGMITCSLKGVVKSLQFRAGKLIAAKSNDPHDSPAWILYEMGIVEEDYGQKVSQNANISSTTTISLLSEQIQKGSMQPNEIEEFMHRRVRRILHDLMSWRDGDYVMELSDVPKFDPALKVQRSIPEMILREVKTCPDPVGLRELMEDPDTMVEQVPVNQHLSQVIQLTAIEQRILKVIRKKIPIRDIIMYEGLGLELTARIILGFTSVGLIRAHYRRKGFAPEKPPQITEAEIPPPKPDTPKPETPKPSPEPPQQKNQVSAELSELDQALNEEVEKLLSQESIEKSPKSIKSDDEARNFLLAKIKSGFHWDPYLILEVDNHCSKNEIESSYREKIDQVTAFRPFISKYTSEYVASYMAMLEESRTILINDSIRKQFDAIQALIDVEKKMKMAASCHKRYQDAMKTKRPILAIIYLKFAIYLDSNFPEYHYKLIYTMTQNRRLRIMSRLLQEHCLERFGTNAHLLALAGLIHYTFGDIPKAKEEYMKALKLDSENDLAQRGLASLNKEP